MDIKGIYVITSEEFAPGRTHEEIAEAAIEGGASVIQIRDKRSSDRRVLEASLIIRKLTRDAGILFIVNDRADIALAADADGVNLGQTDLPIRHARRILGSGKIIGISVDTVDEAKAAQAAGASYAGYGPIFPTSTKLDAGPVTGMEGLRTICAASILPVVAIGGIDETNVARVAAAGAAAVAVVSAVSAAPDMVAATRWLVELFGTAD